MRKMMTQDTVDTPMHIIIPRIWKRVKNAGLTNNIRAWNVLKNQQVINTRRVRNIVATSLYRILRRIARTRSTLITERVCREIPTEMTPATCMMVPKSLHISGFAPPIMSLQTYTGWTNKPTPRSDTARLQYRAFDAACTRDVLLRDINIRMFPITVIRERSELMAELKTDEPVMNAGGWPW